LIRRLAMDWNKAKTILIIAFVILDIFLVSQVMSIRNESRPVVSLDIIKENLSEHDIEIAIDVTGEEMILPLLEVEYMIFNSESNEIREFLGDEYNELIENEYYINADGKSIQINQGKKFLFMTREVESGIKPNITDAAEQIESFARQYQIELGGFYQTGIFTTDNTNRIVYSENYQGDSLENSYYMFIQDGSGVVGFEMQRVRNLRETQANIVLSRPQEALLRLLKYNDIRGETVIGMDICYYRDESLINWNDIVVDNLEPTWKVVFESGTIKYLLEFE
jgi:regulatory protein YycI of two-component signal transduction system YycFG